MNIKPINKTMPILLYYQLEERIKEQIRTQKLKPGDKLPTEQWYMEVYGVSRVTVRKAFSELTCGGILEHVRYKGPVVANSYFVRQANSLTGLSEELEQNGIKVDSKFLYVKNRKANKIDQDILRAEPKENIMEFKRVRYADGRPIVLQTTCVRTKFCEGIDTNQFETSSLYRILETEYHLILSHANQSIEAKLANEEEAKQLQINEGSPLLLMYNIAFLDNEEVIEYSINLYVSSRYHLTMKLFR